MLTTPDVVFAAVVVLLFCGVVAVTVAVLPLCDTVVAAVVVLLLFVVVATIVDVSAVLDAAAVVVVTIGCDAVVTTSSIIIAPSIRLISDVISLPFSSTMNAFSHVIGYLPALQSSGTLYVSVNTVAFSAAILFKPSGVANARSFSPLSIISAP